MVYKYCDLLKCKIGKYYISIIKLPYLIMYYNTPYELGYWKDKEEIQVKRFINLEKCLLFVNKLILK